MRIFAVAGCSGAGKTTFLRALIAELRRRGKTVSVIKHCGSGFDLGGRDKDSSRFLQAGADSVTLTGPKGLAVVRRPGLLPDDRDLAADQAGVDLVFIEGRRIEPGIPVIEIIGLDPKNRILLADDDRWLVVARSPVASSRPVFSPGRTREIASLILDRADEETAVEVQKGKDDFYRAHDPSVRGALAEKTVAIAGAGGLGSNVASALARAGVGTLIIADFDRIEASNLNRQAFFASQIGRPKVEALAENLRQIPSGTKIIGRKVRVTSANVERLFHGADILVEAFDRAEEKQMLIETWMSLFPSRPVVAASGLAGYGANNRIRERRIGTLTLIGDEESEPQGGISPMAPRVGVVAAMQANRVIELLMKGRS